MRARIIFMDAGQGDATLIIRDDGQMILIDCGSQLNKNIVTKPMKEILENTGVIKNGLLALILAHRTAITITSF